MATKKAAPAGKQDVKAAAKNTRKYNKRLRKERHKRRNSYVAAARFVAAALPFALITANGLLKNPDADPAGYLLPALGAFLVVWVLLSFVERAISSGIERVLREEREAERAAAAAADAALRAASESAADPQ